MAQRERIVGIAALSACRIPEARASDLTGTPSYRFMRLDPALRGQVVALELHDGLGVEVSGDLQACTATIDGHALVTIHRSAPDFLRQGPGLVMSCSGLRLERSAEIMAQLGDVISFVGAPLPLSAPRMVETLLAAQRFT